MAKPVIIEITGSDTEPEHPDQEDLASEDETPEATAGQQTGDLFFEAVLTTLTMLNEGYPTRFGSPKLTRDPGS